MDEGKSEPVLTPTQQRIMRVLADGMGHDEAELRGCLADELSVPQNLRVHLTYLRKRLRPSGQDVICEHKYLDAPGRFASSYRLVRRLASAYDGRS